MTNPLDINELTKVLPEELDLFICSASFEERCKMLPEAAVEQIKINNSIVCYYTDLYQVIIENANYLSTKLGNSVDNVIQTEFDSTAPFLNAIRIHEALHIILRDGAIKSILIDISTFTHEGLLIVLRLLLENRANIGTIYLGYIGAAKYDVSEEDPEKKWLSSGISNIRSVVGYPGVISPARKSHLIVLFGFELDRTQVLINTLQFDSLSLGFGPEDDSIEDDHYSINMARHKKLLDKYISASSFCFSLTDPYEAQKHIEEQIAKFPDYNVVIAALNNKISTVGAGLAAYENARIQLIYAKPVEYNTKGYSEPKPAVYLHTLK